jgi:hypothetical protein
MYISTITCNATQLLVEVSANSGQVFGTFQTSLPLAYNTNVSLTPNSNFPSATGFITFGSSDDLPNQPYGSFTFNPTEANTALLMRVFNPTSYGLSWLSFTDDTGNLSTLTGNITLVGNSNMQFRSGNAGAIYLDAGEDLGLNKICETSAQPILTINGISPDSNGNFQLIGNSCVGLEEVQYGLMLSDTCGQPCVGCGAVGQLTTQVSQLENTVLAIQTFSQNLQAVITQATNLISAPCNCN